MTGDFDVRVHDSFAPQNIMRTVGASLARPEHGVVETGGVDKTVATMLATVMAVPQQDGLMQ